MISARRSWPISAYVAGFMVAALIPALMLTYFSSRELDAIQTSAQAHMRKEALAEVKQAVLDESAEITSIAASLAAWEETITQFIDPSFYRYWRQSRVRDVGRFQTLFDGVDLYDRKGRALAPEVASPAAVLRQAINRPVIVYQRSIAFLVYFKPVLMEHETGPSLLGYVGVRADIDRILRAGNRLVHSDASSIRWNLSSGDVVSIEDAMASLELDYTELPEIQAFAQLAESSFHQYLAYIALLLLSIGFLLVVAIARPLRRLVSNIKDVQENRRPELPEDFQGMIGISELARVRDAVNDYRERFHQATENLMEKNRELLVLTYRDTLTGVYNRRAFESHLRLALESAQHDDRHHALCYIDLDQFKIVNDTCGHIAGDELLKQVAARLQSEVRESDMVARLGGDEFGVLLEGCSGTKGIEIAEKLCQSLRKFRFAYEDKVFDVGGSIGLVPINAHSGGLIDVLRAADSACYLAKDRGRNRVHAYQPDDKDLAQRYGEMQWVARITRALEENRFELYCQRIAPLCDPGLSPHFEILVRLREEGELVPPMAFLPAAERYNLITRLDQWVVSHALEALQSMSRYGQAPSIAINLSGQSLGDVQFLEFVSRALEQPGIEPRLVTFEITETAAITNLVAATNFIATLRTRGCRFSLDDFGSGLSSFSYLKNLDVDFLKIDGHFVRQMAQDAVSRSMVEAINRIGHVMGISTIAEFMENAEILARLKEIGVDYVQGYGIDPPKPLAKLAFA